MELLRSSCSKSEPRWSHSFVATSSVDVLGSEVETLEKPLYVNFSLGIRVSVN